MAGIKFEGMGRKEFPSKTTLNLYIREDKSSKMSTFILYVVFGVCLLVIASKFAIFDLYANVNKKQDELDAVYEQVNSYTAQLKGYKELEKKYALYSYGYLNETESTLVDRIEIMNLINEALMSKGTVSSLNIVGNTVTTGISGVTLDQVATIVDNLKSKDVISNVIVNTASTQEEGALVTANMIITFKQAGGEQK